MQVANRYGGGKPENSWFKAVFLVIAWLLIFSLARDVLQIRSGFNRITDSQQRLTDVEKKNLELKKKYELVQTEAYKEKLIREKLNMQKEGEVVAVLPDTLSDKSLSVKEQGPATRENWQKWINILY